MENMDKSKVDKAKIDSFDMDWAIETMNEVIKESADLYCKLKQTKFDYLSLICDLYSRIDHPALIMEHFRKEVDQMLSRCEKS